jgi:hypothetical protein
LHERDGSKVQDLERLVTLKAGEERRIELQPRGQATVRGSVTSSVGSLPEVVPVHLSPRRPDGQRGGFAVGGHFEVQNVEPGTWYVSAQLILADGSSIWSNTSIEVPTTGVVEANLVLEPHH